MCSCGLLVFEWNRNLGGRMPGSRSLGSRRRRTDTNTNNPTRKEPHQKARFFPPSAAVSTPTQMFLTAMMPPGKSYPSPLLTIPTMPSISRYPVKPLPERRWERARDSTCRGLKSPLSPLTPWTPKLAKWSR